MAAAACSCEELEDLMTARRCATLRLSQQNVDWILARAELCTDDAPAILRYIPFFVEQDVEEPLPAIYYDNPEALVDYVNNLCMRAFDSFRDFQSFVRAEYDSNGLVEIEYDYRNFEKRQHGRQRNAEAMAELLADVLENVRESEFGEFDTVYDQETRSFVLREVEGSSGIPVYDKEKKRFVFKRTSGQPQQGA